MFVFDPTFGNSFDKCEKEIRRLMERARAEILFCRTWDERRLAYRIRGCKRGVYVLVYFKGHPDRIAPLERDAKLSEHILRLLVLRADETTPEQMEQAVATGGEQPARSGADAKTAAKATEAAVTPQLSAGNGEAGGEVERKPEPTTTETALVDAPDTEAKEIK
jgi:small subunit ribosomal protein S6